jgi:hypothetical protein
MYAVQVQCRERIEQHRAAYTAILAYSYRQMRVEVDANASRKIAYGTSRAHGPNLPSPIPQKCIVIVPSAQVDTNPLPKCHDEAEKH